MGRSTRKTTTLAYPGDWDYHKGLDFTAFQDRAILQTKFVKCFTVVTRKTTFSQMGKVSSVKFQVYSV